VRWRCVGDPEHAARSEMKDPELVNFVGFIQKSSVKTVHLSIQGFITRSKRFFKISTYCRWHIEPEGMMFSEPIINFYYPLPEDPVPGFMLSNVRATPLGIIASMKVCVYVFRSSRKKFPKHHSFFSGSTLGTASGMYGSCSSFGFYSATIFGSAGLMGSIFTPN
jgi:hypothetical protein